MKIKTKLSAGFALLLLLLAGVTSFGYAQLDRMNDSLNHFYGNRFEKVRIALAVRGEVNSASRLINDIVIGDQDPASGVGEITDRLDNALAQYRLLNGLELNDSELALLDKIEESTDRYGLSLDEFISDVNEGKMEEAKNLYASKLRDEQREVSDLMDELVRAQENALKEEMAGSNRSYDRSVLMVAVLTVAGLLVGAGIVIWVFRSITKGLNLLGKMADRFGRGRLKTLSRLEIRSQDELGELARLFKQIALDLQEKNERERTLSAIQQKQVRMNAQLARVTELLQEGTDLKGLCQSFISEFAPAFGAAHGLVYLETAPSSEGALLELSGAYASLGDEAEGGSVKKAIRFGEGLAGQSFRDAKPLLVQDVPEGYYKIGSGLGEAEPKALLIQPILYENAAIGIVELASVTGFDSEHRDLLEALCEKLGTIVHNIRSRQRVEELLQESQAMTEELQVQSEELVCQQEELRETNDKLERQQEELKKSEQRLQQQQDELEHANRELTVKKLALEQHVERVEHQNKQIARANAELERQAVQLALTTKYKTEFLANMSHELRTPLNGLLILSEFLAENKEGNLTDKQREYVQTIRLSGNDLLKMIDEILDLSKVDAGKMDIYPEWTVLNDIAAFLDHQYVPLAAKKGLSYESVQADDIPAAIVTDGHRLKQIMRNLLSNAFKFTEAGTVTLALRKPTEEELSSPRREEGMNYVALSVTDTGIGISDEKREIVFEAFRQADGTTSRKYGGTGLGLTISRELAHLLGGWIHLASEPGRGSAFTLVLPERLPEPRAIRLSEVGAALEAWPEGKPAEPAEPAESAQPAAESAAIPSDPAFAAQEAESSAGGPDVPIGSPDEEDAELAEGKRPGALSRKDEAFADKKILLADDDVRNEFALSSVLENQGMKVVYAENGVKALAKLEEEADIDLVLMDVMMPEMDGYEATRRIRENPAWSKLPVIALTAKAMKDDRNKCIEAGASDYIAKPVNTEQLLSLMRVWLHR